MGEVIIEHSSKKEKVGGNNICSTRVLVAKLLLFL
jgi:hypothetical protein